VSDGPESARPSPDLVLLLRAALGDARVAAEAWQVWCKRVSFDDMGEASMRLMPLVSKNLATHGIEHELTGRLRGIHRYWWSRNQHLLHRLARVIDLLAAESIDVMVLKGVPLALRYYGDPGLRPMSDFDLLVPTRDADRALARLRAGGWKPTEPIRIHLADRTIDTRVYPGVGLVDGEGQECDLHWHVLHDCCFDGADESIWRHAETLSIHDRSFLAPDATDLLMHVCVHGATYNPMPPVRWIADAAMILRTAGDRVDWDRLVFEAETRLLAVVMREAVEVLRETVDADVPASVVARLRSARTRRVEEREYRLRQLDKGYLRTLTGRRCQFRRQYPNGGPLSSVAKVPDFLQQIWSLPTKRVIPRIILFYVLPAYLKRVVTGHVVEGHPHPVAD
jgi:hypothetical protein